MACKNKNLESDRAVTLHIKVKRNDTFNSVFTLLEDGAAFDFTNFDEANMQVKSRSDSETVILLLTIANSRITLGGSAGTVTFSVDKDDMDLDSGTYVYDIEILNTSSDERETIVEGKFIVSNDTTRV